MISSKNTCRRFALGLAFAASLIVHAQSVDPSLYSGLRWRNIGPMRAGRVSAVSGVIGQPGTFYMGLPMGGVWKTTSAGVTWYPIFDDIKTSSSVGALEVAPSDPNVIYVGMGDMNAGGGIAQGDGMYKSADAGKTWQKIGLEDGRHIPSILVDPKNPDIVLAAVKGNRFAKSEERGVYKSTDGGKTWTKTLYVSDTVGGQKIAWAPDHPEVILATTVRNYSDPNGQGGGGSAGGSTKLFKSTDQGSTWTELKGNGLPDLSSRTCVAVANGTDAQRIFIVGNNGLYRSDDGGTNWRRMAKEDWRAMNGQGGYNCGVYVNPKDPDTVYLVNTCTYISKDGGNTFTGWKGAPGGDDPQQMWLDPTDGNRIFLGMDQGATVTFDGGKTWSNWYNQVSGQIYHVAVDNQFPYWVYGTEQDSGCVGVASRGNFGAITPLDWLPHPGFEFGSLAIDPVNPKVSYAGGIVGITKVTYPSGQFLNVSPALDPEAKLRTVLNQPVAFNPNNIKELLAGFQCLMSTTDGGVTWKTLSPDLGFAKGEEPKDEKSKPGSNQQEKKGNVAEPEMEADPDEVPDGDEEEMRAAQMGRRGGAIESFSVSTVSPSTMWAGTSNGLIKVTKDRGKTWEDVTIPNLPNPRRADISAIDASHHDAATAYAAVDIHGAGDLKPYLYRTTDFGKTWTPIVNGLPKDEVSGSFTRVIRADTKKKGLLFAGTESSVYVSFDNGDHWQPLTLNLPNTSFRDMVIKDNDLVVCTYGRGFWILDDFSPLREVSPAVASEPAHLFAPGLAYRIRRNVNGDTPYPPEVASAPNAPDGALIYYHLASEPSSDVSIEIKDSADRTVRRYSSAALPALPQQLHPIPEPWKGNPKPISKAAGMNRINWDLRYDSPPTFEHTYEMNANYGRTPPAPEGMLALPGTYKVVLTVDGKQYEQKVEVKNDPRSPAKPKDLKAQFEVQWKCYSGAQDAYTGFQQVDAMRQQVAELLRANPPAGVQEAARDFDNKLSAIGGNGRPMNMVVGLGFGEDHQSTFAGVNRLMVDRLKTQDNGDMAPVKPVLNVCEAACRDLNAVEWKWKQFNAKELVDFNAILTKNGLKPIPAAAGVGNPKQPVEKKEQKN